MVPVQSVVCAIRTRLWSRWWFRCRLLLIQLFASRVSKHDMGALLCLNVETHKRAPTPLFGPVRCVHVEHHAVDICIIIYRTSWKFLNKCPTSRHIFRLHPPTHWMQFALRPSASICVHLQSSTCICLHLHVFAYNYMLLFGWDEAESWLWKKKKTGRGTD